jgi:hypothetical protein
MRRRKVEGVIRFICAYCAKTTTQIVSAEKPAPEDVIKVCYCEHCNRANKVPIDCDTVNSWGPEERLLD